MSDLDDIIKEFLVESYENLDQLDRNLVALEQAPTDGSILSSVFRTIHTIKGTCGFLGLETLAQVTHEGESLLSRLRDGTLRLNTDITSGLLAMVDAIREMLACVEATGQDGDGDYTALLETLARLQTPRYRIGDILVERGYAQPEDVAQALQAQQSGDPRHLGEILVAQGTVQSHQILDALAIQGETRVPAASESTIRVDVGLLDTLMQLVAELMLVRDQCLQWTASPTDLAWSFQRLDCIVTALQTGLMQTRMQPIGTLWSKFPRLVRDLAMTCGKQVRIEMEGKETELDKTIIEAIKDPLTHLVRNAVDHGVETPEVRLARGKPAAGCLCLRACHAGGEVHITIADDGAGLDPARLKQKAQQCGLITPAEAARMDDREAVQLIFLPGFSTAEKVTNVSGRGVGMDVVQTNIARVGGTVAICGKVGQGTTLHIKIPQSTSPPSSSHTGGQRGKI